MNQWGLKPGLKIFGFYPILCQGMNPKDLLLLKKENIEGNIIKFIRQKTKDTTRDITEITVPVIPAAKQIIDKWKNKTNRPFLFDIVSDNMDQMKIYKTVQQFVKNTNKHMNKIAEKVGVRKNITTYLARYQFTKAMIDGGKVSNI